MSRLVKTSLWCYTAAQHNVIADGFYDVGQLKGSDQLRSLEEYGKDEVNQTRPVIVINPRPESVNRTTTVMSYRLGCVNVVRVYAVARCVKATLHTGITVIVSCLVGVLHLGYTILCGI